MASNTQLCPTCNIECVNDCIECSSCYKWVHFSCIGITIPILEKWLNKDIQFLCRICVCLDESYNYLAAFKRIQKYRLSSKKKCQAFAENELVLLETYQDDYLAQFPHQVEDAPGESDEVSCEILKMFQPIILEQYSPREIAGDGNCLFRCASLGFYSCQSQNLHLRLLTTLELMKYQDFYDVNSKSYKGLLDDRIITSDYNTILNLAMHPGSRCCEILHIYALSAALRVPIMLYCPPNSLFQSAFTRLVVGRDVEEIQPAPVTIMWTQHVVPSHYTEFLPNHFCLLHPTNRENQVSEISLNSSIPFSSFDTSIQNAEKRRGRNVVVELNENSSDIVSGVHVLSSSTVVDVPQQSEAIENGDEISVSSEITIRSSGTKLKYGKFLDMYDIVRALSTSDNIHNDLPCGIKENIYFVVLNETNMIRRKNGLKSTFKDDCGVWNLSMSTSPKSCYLVVNETCYKVLHPRDGVYCTEKMLRKKKIYTPLEPQPKKDRLLEIQRQYTSHKTDSAYKRRVSWINYAPKDMGVNLHCAVVEYIGSYPGLYQPMGLLKRKRNTQNMTNSVKRIRKRTKNIQSTPDIQ